MTRDPYEIMSAVVKDKYLKLHRENYLDLNRDTDMRLAVEQWVEDFSVDEVLGLLSEMDWRPRVVAIHCLALMPYPWVPNRLSLELLSNPPWGFTARPLSLALARKGGDLAKTTLTRFLNLPYDNECFYEYASALGALHHLKDKNYRSLRTAIAKRLQGESFYEKGMLEEQEERVCWAIQYWS